MFLFKLALLHARRSTRGLYTPYIKYNFECSFNKSIVKSRFFKLQQGKRKLPSFDERAVRTEKRNISQSLRLFIVHRSQHSIVKKRVTVWIY